jgi:hypothetical protein
MALPACNGGYKEGHVVADKNIVFSFHNVSKSFGNQVSQLGTDNESESVKSGDWIYTVIMLSTNEEAIIRYDINDIKNREVLYKVNEVERLHQLSLYNKHIYFLEGMGAHGNEKMQLKKIKTGGGQADDLISSIDAYIISNGKIYYQKNNWLRNTDIYSANLDGRNKKNITKQDYKEHSIDLMGTYGHWIYYAKQSSTNAYDSQFNIYRVKLDGTKVQIVIAEELYNKPGNKFNIFIPDGKYNYFFHFKHFDGDITEADLIKQSDDGEMQVIATGSGARRYILNKEDQNIFFSENNKLYKINVEENNCKTLIYEAKHDINSILLFNDDILVSTAMGDMYIKGDGSIIELEGLDSTYNVVY